MKNNSAAQTIDSLFGGSRQKKESNAALALMMDSVATELNISMLFGQRGADAAKPKSAPLRTQEAVPVQQALLASAPDKAGSDEDTFLFTPAGSDLEFSPVKSIFILFCLLGLVYGGWFVRNNASIPWEAMSKFGIERPKATLTAVNTPVTVKKTQIAAPVVIAVPAASAPSIPVDVTPVATVASVQTELGQNAQNAAPDMPTASMETPTLTQVIPAVPPVIAPVPDEPSSVLFDDEAAIMKKARIKKLIHEKHKEREAQFKKAKEEKIRKAKVAKKNPVPAVNAQDVVPPQQQSFRLRKGDRLSTGELILDITDSGDIITDMRIIKKGASK